MTYILKDGDRIRIDAAGNEIIEDGGSYRKSMVMLDSKPPAPAPTQVLDASRHKPHALPRTSVDDARAASARQKYIDRVNDGWRQSASSQLEPNTVAALAPEFAQEEAAYDKSKQRISNQWKDGKTVTRADADAAWAKRNRQLEDAWKNPKSVA